MGTISLGLPSDGQTIDAADVNTPFNTIAAVINGNIDDDNIKSGANINGTKLLAGSIPGSAFNAATAGGWISDTTNLPAPNTITNNGNRSYDMVFNSADVTDTVSIGMRLKLTRTVTAPTQCTDLESGSSQYYSKTTPNKLTFTDDYTVMGWVKLESYTAGGIIARRNADTEGWSLSVNAAGQVLAGSYRIAANNSVTTSYQSLPLGKWCHVAASTDLSGTSVLIYIDGVLVPSATVITGTITALVQGTTALVVGAEKSAGTNPFDGKIAQAAVFSSVLAAATIRSYMSQTLSGSETNIASAYSFNGVITDLNTTTPNDLTAQGSAVATNADSPFGLQADLTTAGTTDYAIVTKTAFSTNTTLTVQVPEGCAIPTSGGVSAVSYSTQKAPYGFPAARGRWRLCSRLRTNSTTTSNATFGAFLAGGYALGVPIGEWTVGHQHGSINNSTTTSVSYNISPTALTGLTLSQGNDTSPFQVKTVSSAAAEYNVAVYIAQPQTIAAFSTYVMYTLGATTSALIGGANALSEIFAEFDLL